MLVEQNLRVFDNLCVCKGEGAIEKICINQTERSQFVDGNYRLWWSFFPGLHDRHFPDVFLPQTRLAARFP